MLLTIRNLHAGYGRLPVLRGVDVDVAEGEINILIGPNGAGKTTVLKSIFGITDIQKGSIVFKDQDLRKVARHDLIRLGVNFVPQGRIVFPNLTVEGNLRLGGLILDDDLLKERLAKMLEEFPLLKRKFHQTADSLSGGEQQILAIARGLITDPALLLLDEPSLGLAPKMVQEVFGLIQQIRDRGIAVLLVEQNAKKACEIADKIYLLESGELALSGGREVLSHPTIKRVYLGGA